MTARSHDPSSLVLTLRRLNRAFAVNNRVVGGRVGIKESDLGILDILNQQGQQTPSELARAARIHPATLTGVLTRLERDGWVRRSTDEVDRRSVRMEAAGAETLGDLFATPNAEIADAVDGLTPEQLGQFSDLLDRVADAVTRLTDRLDPP